MAIVSDINSLVLHLKLDEVVPKNTGGEAKSLRSEVGHSILGNPQGVISELFGSCLSFNGENDYIEIADTDEIDFGVDEDFTVAVWVNVAASQKDTINGDNDIVEKWGGVGGYPYVIRYLRNEQTIMAARSDGSNVPQIITTTKLQSDKFYHVAFIKQQKNLYLYLDGKLQGSTTDTTKNETKNNSPLYLGKRGGDTPNFFTGKLANLRIYSKALTIDELKEDIQADLSAIALFNKVYPIDFKLYEGENRESVIFIENGAQGQELTLEINNNSAQSISFPHLTGEPTQSSHHLELRFRPNTLSPAAIKKLTLASDSWSMSKPVTHSNGTVSLYFIVPNSTLPLEPTFLTLQNVNGAIEGGSRTTRVELKIPQVSINQNENVVNYFQEQRLDVINHRGKKNIPLHVGFVNSNQILNDGQTTNSLTLKIANISRDTVIPLQPTSKGDEASRFTISFDVDTDWALGTKSQVKSIEISGKDWQQNGQPEADWQINQEEQGESPSWTITHDNNESAELAPQQVIQLTLSKIVSSLPAGNTNLYLRYENIPGYWDGTFICAIEKTPLLVYHSKVGNKQEVGLKFPKDLFGGSSDEAWIKYHNNHRGGEKSTLEIAAKNDPDDHIALIPSGNVGIGTTEPREKLDVVGNIKAEKIETEKIKAENIEVLETITADKFVGEGAFVTGMITMWSGAIDKIPRGWALCNGNNKTPNLSGRFIVGYQQNDGSYNKLGKTGGASSVTLNIDQMPKHNHSGSTSNAGEHHHWIEGTDASGLSKRKREYEGKETVDMGFGGGSNSDPDDERWRGGVGTNTEADHYHNVTINGGGRPHENRPPYYVLAYIIKL